MKKTSITHHDIARTIFKIKSHRFMLKTQKVHMISVF